MKFPKLIEFQKSRNEGFTPSLTILLVRAFSLVGQKPLNGIRNGVDLIKTIDFRTFWPPRRLPWTGHGQKMIFSRDVSFSKKNQKPFPPSGPFLHTQNQYQHSFNQALQKRTSFTPSPYSNSFESSHAFFPPLETLQVFPTCVFPTWIKKVRRKKSCFRSFFRVTQKGGFFRPLLR